MPDTSKPGAEQFGGMKIIPLVVGLAAVFTTSLFAGETLRLKLESDRPVVLKGSPQEVVVKISDAVGGEHWGGANDGKWHKSIKGFGLNVGRDGKVGTVWIDDVSVRVAP